MWKGAQEEEDDHTVSSSKSKLVVGARSSESMHPLPIADWRDEWDGTSFDGLQYCEMEIEFNTGEDSNESVEREQLLGRVLGHLFRPPLLQLMASYFGQCLNLDHRILEKNSRKLPQLVSEVYAYQSGENEGDEWLLVRVPHLPVTDACVCAHADWTTEARIVLFLRGQLRLHGVRLSR